MPRRAVAPVLSAALALLACGQGKVSAPETPPLATPSAALPPPAAVDASATPVFVSAMETARRIETETSRAAAARTRNAAVRRFAERAIRESRAAQAPFDRLAAEAGAPPPAAAADARAIVARIGREPPSAFDAHYLDAFINARAAAIDELERYAQSGEAPLLRRWAADALPAARARLQEAETLRQSVNVAPG